MRGRFILPDMMRKVLSLTAVACFLPAVFQVACAGEQAVNVYVSQVSISYPDPAGVDDLFSKNKAPVEVVLGFVAPRGCQFVSGGKDSTTIGVTDASGSRKEAAFDNFFTRIEDSGAFAKHVLKLKQRPVFPLKLDGVVNMKVSEGTKTFQSQEFDVRRGVKFKVDGLEITVNDARGIGKADGELELLFNDTHRVKEITLTDTKGGKLEVTSWSKSSTSFDPAVSTHFYTYQVKNMPAKMKVEVVVNKGVKTVDVPVKVTVDVNAPAGKGA